MKKTLLLLAATSCVAAATRAQSFTNAGLESWHHYSAAGLTMETPDGWTSHDSTLAADAIATTPGRTFHPSVTKETSIVHGGSAAARIETIMIGDTVQYFYGGMNNGGTPVTTRIESVSAWLHFVPAEPGDIGTFTVRAIKKNFAAHGGDSVVGSGVLPVPGSGGVYVKCSNPIIYDNATVVPDLISVSFQSVGSSLGNTSEGSVLYVDDVTMKAAVTGIETPLFSGETINIYPNPATDMLHIQTSVTSSTRFSVYDATGRQLWQKDLQGSADLDINSLPAGAYIYQLHTQDGATQLFQGSFIKK